MPARRILLIDDDPGYRQMLARFFQKRAPMVDMITAQSGAEGLHEILRKSPDLVLLDLSLRDMNGFEVLRRLRAEPATAQMEVLVVTGLLNSSDLLRSAALGLKAQDFVEKREGPQAIVERVRAMLASRAYGHGELLDFGRLKIDRLRRRAWIDGIPLELSQRRFKLLCVLADSKDGVSTRILKDLLWGPDASPNTVTKAANRLRASLPSGHELIVAIPGGYKLAKLS